MVANTRETNATESDYIPKTRPDDSLNVVRGVLPYVVRAFPTDSPLKDFTHYIRNENPSPITSFSASLANFAINLLINPFLRYPWRGL